MSAPPLSLANGTLKVVIFTLAAVRHAIQLVAARGINPGTPVVTTELNRILVVMRSRISCMASSGRGEMSKFYWMRQDLVEVVRKAVPRCTAQASAT